MVKKKSNAGRPTVLTAEAIRKIEEIAALDGSVKEMALYAGIHYDTIYARMREDPKFSERIDTLRETAILKARRTFIAALDKPYYAVEYLRRKRRAEFADRQELTGADGQPVVNITDLIKNKLGADRPIPITDTK